MPAPLQGVTEERNAQHLKVLSRSFGYNKNIKECMDKELSSKIDIPAVLLCNMCFRKDVCVNVQNNIAIVLTVTDITRLPSWDIKHILASVCPRCLVYIRAIKDSSSELRMRCEQALQNQNIVLAPPTPDPSPNNCFQVSKTLLDDSSSHSQRNCYEQDFSDQAANDISMPVVTSTPPHSSTLPVILESPIFKATSRSPSPSNTGQNSMLEYHSELHVSPLSTECGGDSKNKKRSYQNALPPVQMICTHCGRAYWRKDYYRKHMRRCSAKFRYAKSMVSQRSRNRSRLELDAISVISEGNEQIKPPRKSLTYHCNNCSFTVSNFSEIKQHKRTHLPSYECDICNSSFSTKYEYEFHHTQCMSKIEVYEKALSSAKDEVNSAPARRKTRSFTLALSCAPSLAPSKNESLKTTKKPAKKSQATKKNVHKANYYEDEQSDTSNYIERHKSIYGDKRSHNERDLNDSDEDDGVSETDTLYASRMSLTNRWVDSISSHSHLSQSDIDINDYEEDFACSTLKEYDLHLLERLKIEVRQSSLTCFVSDCNFTCTKLNEMMKHDYIDHFKKPWFNCYKCDRWFTSKVFLDYHLDLQNKGRYVCYLCGEHFQYQNQLNRHLIQHSKVASYGGEKYICHFCNLKFLDEYQLIKHCNYENHHWHQKRHTIEIDHTMTISNKVLQKRRIEDNKKNQVKILKMVLKPMHTKRCTPMEKYRSHLPAHLKIPKRIGKVVFPYPSNPNCVGCL